MSTNNAAVIAELDRVLGYVTDPSTITPDEIKRITKETVTNIGTYVNEGWLDIRKSAGNGDDVEVASPALEWTDGGEYFYDITGERYIDCLGGYGVFTTGHRNPEIIKYVKLQLSRLGLHSQELLEPMRAYLAKTVSLITPGDMQYAFFTNGGAEAVEMALKLARIATGGRWILSTKSAFHGKTNGSLTATGKSFTRKAFLPMIQQSYHVNYGDAEAVRAAIENLHFVGEQVACVIVEPIQGEGGVNIPPKGYLQALREICDEHGVMLILDEIQTGMGRTGTMWCCEQDGIVPDIMTFGKSFGGGIVPITGIAVRPHLWTDEIKANPNLLGSPTFGGNPISCVAALATIKYIVENDIPAVCAAKGKIIMDGLQKLKAKYPEILLDVRGKGLLIGMEYENSEIGYYVAKTLFANHVLTAGTEINARIIRIEPPAVISEESISTLLTTLDRVLGEARAKFKA